MEISEKAPNDIAQAQTDNHYRTMDVLQTSTGRVVGMNWRYKLIDRTELS